MMNGLIDQVRWNCTVLDAVKRCAQSSEDVREIDNALETGKSVIEKVRETLKTVPSLSLNDGIYIVADERHILYHNQLKFPESASVYPTGSMTFSLRQSGLPQSIVRDFSTGFGILLRKVWL